MYTAVKNFDLLGFENNDKFIKNVSIYFYVLIKYKIWNT